MFIGFLVTNRKPTIGYASNKSGQSTDSSIDLSIHPSIRRHTWMIPKESSQDWSWPDWTKTRNLCFFAIRQPVVSLSIIFCRKLSFFPQRVRSHGSIFRARTTQERPILALKNVLSHIFHNSSRCDIFFSSLLLPINLIPIVERPWVRELKKPTNFSIWKESRETVKEVVNPSPSNFVDESISSVGLLWLWAQW